MLVMMKCRVGENLERSTYLQCLFSIHLSVTVYCLNMSVTFVNNHMPFMRILNRFLYKFSLWQQSIVDFFFFLLLILVQGITFILTLYVYQKKQREITRENQIEDDS